MQAWSASKLSPSFVSSNQTLHFYPLRPWIYLETFWILTFAKYKLVEQLAHKPENQFLLQTLQNLIAKHLLKFDLYLK